jgi:Glycosyltransferase family 87
MRNRTFNFLATSFGLLALVLFVFTDFKLPQSLAISDYLMTFHTAGHMFAEGRASQLYPPLDAKTFTDTPFDREAHLVNKNLPPSSTAEFMYPPIISLIFAPFSFLPLPVSLLVWQCVCLVALVLVNEAVLGPAPKDEPEEKWRPLNLAFAGLAFLPVLFTVWIGQVGLVLGILPLALAFRLLLKKRPIQAGFVLSLCVLKPQFLVPALFLSTSMVLEKKPKCFIAMCWGIAAILLLNLLFFGPSTMGSWFNCLKVSDLIYSDARSVNTALATSFPRAVMLILPVAYQVMLKPYVYLLGAFVGLLAYMTALRLIQVNISDDLKLAAVLILGIFVTPLTVPHIFFYDYSILYLAGLLAISMPWSHDRRWEWRSITRLCWLIVNVYGVIICVHKQYAVPIILIGFMFFFYQRVIEIVENMRTKDAVEPVPIVNF